MDVSSRLRCFIGAKGAESGLVVVLSGLLRSWSLGRRWSGSFCVLLVSLLEWFLGDWTLTGQFADQSSLFFGVTALGHLLTFGAYIRSVVVVVVQVISPTIAAGVKIARVAAPGMRVE